MPKPGTMPRPSDFALRLLVTESGYMETSPRKYHKQLYLGTVNGQGWKPLDDSGRGLRFEGLAESGRLFPSVTILALCGSRIVNDYRLAGYFARQLMAVQARHIAVSAIERILRLFVVVKLRWLPTHGVVTT